MMKTTRENNYFRSILLSFLHTILLCHFNLRSLSFSSVFHLIYNSLYPNCHPICDFFHNLIRCLFTDLLIFFHLYLMKQTLHRKPFTILH